MLVFISMSCCMYMSQFNVFTLSHFNLNLISCKRKQSIADGPGPVPSLSMTSGCVRIAPELGFYTSFLPTSFCRYTDSSNITSHSEYVPFLPTATREIYTHQKDSVSSHLNLRSYSSGGYYARRMHSETYLKWK